VLLIRRSLLAGPEHTRNPLACPRGFGALSLRPRKATASDVFAADSQGFGNAGKLEAEQRMSVHGEFQRLLAECVDFLANNSARQSDWPASLERADAHVEDSLNEAATMVLALRSGVDALEAPVFEDGSEADAYEALADHLTQICYAIVGR
jgi:hypothetical protein